MILYALQVHDDPCDAAACRLRVLPNWYATIPIQVFVFAVTAAYCVQLYLRALPFIVMNQSLPWEKLCRRFMIGHIAIGS